MTKYQPLHTITHAEYFTMSPEEFDAIQPQLDAILAALEESLKRKDVWSAANIALLLPTWMIADDLKTFAKRLEEYAPKRALFIKQVNTCH